MSNEFENPAFEEDEIEEDASGKDPFNDPYNYYFYTGNVDTTLNNLPSVPNEPADAIRNEQARKDF